MCHNIGQPYSHCSSCFTTLPLLLSFNFLCPLPFNTLRNLHTNSMCSNTQIFPILPSLTASFRMTQKLRSVLSVKKIPPKRKRKASLPSVCVALPLKYMLFIKRIVCFFFHFYLQLTLLLYFKYNNEIKETCFCLGSAYKEQACHPLSL